LLFVLFPTFQHRVLRGGQLVAGSSFSPPATATTIADLIGGKGSFKDAHQQFQERLLAEMEKTASTANPPFNTDEGDVVSIIQERVQSFYNALDEKDALRIKENLRKLTTMIDENKDLASIIQESILKDPDQEYTFAGDTADRIEDAARKLNAVLTTEQQQLEQEESTMNKDTAIIQNLLIALEEGSGEDVDAFLVDMIKGLKSSFETLHDTLKEHHQMDIESEEFGQLLVRLPNLISNGDVNHLQDPCNGDQGCQVLVWIVLIPVILILILLSPILLILFIISLPITLPLAFILFIAYLLNNPQGDTTPATSCDGCDGQ
jgi:hypothetical protein